MTWFKSSYSDGNGDCVEVAWLKSSHSDDNGNCVEVALGTNRVGTRDSKSTDQELSFPSRSWSSFVASLKR